MAAYRCLEPIRRPAVPVRAFGVEGGRYRLGTRPDDPKTEHHAGGESRIVPLFPELLPDLERAWDEAEPGTEFVVARYRDANVNLRTQFLRVIRRAGLKPWPRLFHNLRASRQTELTARFPPHVVCEWIGNSAPIADKHYLQVTDAHYADAARLATCEPTAGEGSPQSGARAAQNRAQQAHAGFRGDSQSAGENNKKARKNRAGMPIGSIGHLVPPRGNEQIEFSQGNREAAEKWVQAVGDANGESGLAMIDLTAWLNGCPVPIDAATRDGIMAMIWAAGGGEDRG